MSNVLLQTEDYQCELSQTSTLIHGRKIHAVPRTLMSAQLSAHIKEICG